MRTTHVLDDFGAGACRLKDFVASFVCNLKHLCMILIPQLFTCDETKAIMIEEIVT